MVRVSRKWIKTHVSYIYGMQLDDLDNITIWKEGWRTSLSGKDKKYIENRDWNGEFFITFSDVEAPVKACVSRR